MLGKRESAYEQLVICNLSSKYSNIYNRCKGKKIKRVFGQSKQNLFNLRRKVFGESKFGKSNFELMIGNLFYVTI